MDFRDPRFIDDERAEMFFGMDAGDAPGDQRAEHQFQPPAPEKHQRLGIDENKLIRRRVRLFCRACSGFSSRHKLFKLPRWENPRAGACQ